MKAAGGRYYRVFAREKPRLCSGLPALCVAKSNQGFVFDSGEGIMSKINLSRVILGGIVAGIIIDIFEYVLNGVVLNSQWADLMTKLNLPMIGMNQIIWFNVLGLVLGIVAVWTYAAIRPRFGAGVKTAVIAGLLTWVTAYLLAAAFPAVSGIFPMSLAIIMVCVGLVEIVVATIAGAWLYKE
jgi:hypothetical protein